MTTMPNFATIEDCVAYLPTHPIERTEEVTLELDSDILVYCRERAEQLGCAVEVFISAVITMDYQESQRAASGG